MALNIDGTTGISGVDGSASAPALQGTDSNTGINFASDTVNINTGGVTRATIDSNGRLGIGTTSPLSGAKLTVADNGLAITGQNVAHSANSLRLGEEGSGLAQFRAYGSDTSTAGSFQFTVSNSDGTGGATDALRIDSSGNVGIGDPNPEGLLHVGTGTNTDGTDVDVIIGGASVNTRQARIRKKIQSSDRALEIYAATGSSDEDIRFFRDQSTETMRIDSGGKLLVGTTSGSNFSNNVAEFLNTTADAAVGVRSATGASQQDYITFRFGGSATACGGIRRDGTTQGVELFSNSDRRIKTNILDMDNTLDKINQLSLKKFDFKEGGSGIGLIAQDLISIFPNKVKKDDSDDGTGDTVPNGVEAWTVGHNFTYELLKAVQELSAKVETLETKVAALEAG